MVTQMCKKSVGALFIVLGISSGAIQGAAAATRVEVDVENVFAAEKGFDDNDQVEAVVHGQLPNACYKLADTVLEAVRPGKIHVTQYATHITEGLCSNEEAMPKHMKMSVPFNKVVNIGQLKAGTYTIEFLFEDTQHHTRVLKIETAQVPTTDNLPYALVSSAWLPDVMDSSEEVKVTLSGSLNSSCTNIDRVQILRESDVVVLLPVLKVTPNVLCLQVLIPFVQEVNLGKMAVGDYLVHVRSMNGTSVNHVFKLRQ